MNKLFRNLAVASVIVSVGTIVVLALRLKKAKLNSNVEYDDPTGAKEPIEGEYTVVT